VAFKGALCSWLQVDTPEKSRIRHGSLYLGLEDDSIRRGGPTEKVAASPIGHQTSVFHSIRMPSLPYRTYLLGNRGSILDMKRTECSGVVPTNATPARGVRALSAQFKFIRQPFLYLLIILIH
jgi:hypothetical protein